jgi:hypothetical protein
MTVKPFLLDPGYEGTLDSSACRERFWARNNRSLAGGFFAFLVLYIPVAILTGVGIARNERPELLAAGIIGATVTVVFAFFFVVYLCDIPRVRRVRRLAWEGELLTGRIVSCLRKCYYTSTYEVEVQYEVELPSGQTVKGTQAAPRDDLLNETLPAPGTPVVVLMLDETMYAML